MELVVDRICQELDLPRAQVAATVGLLNEGNTVPFIARYRKEATGSLDEVAIRNIEDRVNYYKELLDRRETVLKSIEKQEKMTPELRARIENAWSKTELEDLYLPFKPKKRTKATIARELGLEPLLDALLQDTTGADPMMLAAAYVKADVEGVATPSLCVEGAGHILAERLAEDADIRSWLRQEFFETGIMQSTLREEKKSKSGEETGEVKVGAEALRFKSYWDFKEPIKKMPGHRMLALRRGEKEDVLTVKLLVDREKLVTMLVSRVRIEAQSGYRASLHAVCEDAFDRLLAPTLETDVRMDAKKKADLEAIQVFQTNLDHLLLAPPAGQMCTLGVDPGIRTGCKLAVINRLGQFMETATIYPLEPKRDLAGSTAVLNQIAEKYPLEAITIGNGTGGREVEAFIRAWIRETDRNHILCVTVSEAGASVYSASDIAREEFPDQDVTVRGAISIARRFQDPLSELVKVEPKSIGVGQYQHDVNQTALKKGLDDVVESCVNRVGVDLNTASYRLLSYVAGIGDTLAKNILQYRFDHGAFKRREQLMEVTRFGEKAFTQSAGFLRIRDGENPLDQSAVHPEAYPVVQRICQLTGKTVPELVGNEALLDGLDPKTLTDDRFGVETVSDIIAELRKPGRDPRQKFEVVQFKEGVNKPSDLEIGMELQGIVTNVTDFGAFVDIGVHQDGLVHLSEISHTFVKNPAQALTVGQVVKVKVMSVDLQAKRIGLSIKALQVPPVGQGRNEGRTGRPEHRTDRPRNDRPNAARDQKPRSGGEKAFGDRKPRSDGRPAQDGQRPKTDGPRPPRPADSRPAAGRPARTEYIAKPDSQRKPDGKSASMDDLLAKFNKGIR